MIKMMMVPSTTTTTIMPEVTTNKTTFVTFSRRRQVRPSLHIQDYTQEEMANCWYTIDELQTKFGGGGADSNNNNNDGCCLRGIERCSFQKKQIRAVSKQVVFKEQYRQLMTQTTTTIDNNNDNHGVEKIAQVYAAKTKGSQTLARILAQCDQEYVKGIQKQEQQKATTNNTNNTNEQQHQHQQQQESSSSSSSRSSSSNNGVMMQPMMVSCCTSRAA